MVDRCWRLSCRLFPVFVCAASARAKAAICAWPRCRGQMSLRIGMLSQWYDPELGSAALPGLISRSLVSLGHKVDVLTGFPNYPNGSMYPGYKVRMYQAETIGGVRVHRSPLYASHDMNALRRVSNYMSFALGSTVIGVTRFPKVDVILVHSTPATVAIPAMVIKAMKGTPFVVHVQDLWPQTVVSSGFLGERKAASMEAALQRDCDLVYNRAAAVAVTSPSMAQAIASRGVPDTKITLLPNWADETAFYPAPIDAALRAEFGLRRRFTVMYAGNFGEFQALDVLLEAAELLRSRVDIGFALVGGGVTEARLRTFVGSARLDNVTFVPSQRFDNMSSVLALGDAQVVSLQNLPLFQSTLPSKLQATLAAGRPIIGAVSGDAEAVIRRAGAGLVVTPGSASELARAITALADLPTSEVAALGMRGRQYYLDNFSQDVTSRRLAELLDAASESGVRT